MTQKTHFDHLAAWILFVTRTNLKPCVQSAAAAAVVRISFPHVSGDWTGGDPCSLCLRFPHSEFWVRLFSLLEQKESLGCAGTWGAPALQAFWSLHHRCSSPTTKRWRVLTPLGPKAHAVWYICKLLSLFIVHLCYEGCRICWHLISMHVCSFRSQTCQYYLWRAAAASTGLVFSSVWLSWIKKPLLTSTYYTRGLCQNRGQ